MNEQDKSKSLANLVKLHNTREKVPALEITRDRPLSALLSKAINPTIQANHTDRGTRKVETPSVGVLHKIASRTANNIMHSDTTMQMLPDMQLGSQILVSSVASPKDMMTTELTYKSTPGILPPNVLATVIAEMRDHFNKFYKIKNNIPRILNEILFEKGSHVRAIIPENAIDEMINRSNAVSMESFCEAIGSVEIPKDGSINTSALTASINLLGPGLEGFKDTATREKKDSHHLSFSIGNESLEEVYKSYNAPHTFSQKLHIKIDDHPIDVLEHITITDNPNVLRIAKIEEKLRKDQINARLKMDRSAIALESITAGKIKLDDRSLKNLIYKSRRIGVHTMQVFKTDNQLDRRSIGRPLDMVLPSESVIPVYTPGEEENHVGYFILLDQSGNPVKAMNEQDTFGAMQSRMMKASNQTSNIQNRLKQLVDGLGCSEVEHNDVMNRVYGDMVEQDLLARLRNGMYANSVALGKNDGFYRVMLSRVFQQQHTTVLFMPADMVVYFARKYNQYGIGVSILDEMKLLNNMRAIAMMSNTMLGIKNSIPRTDIELNIDEDDPDPYKTAEMLMNEVARVNQTALPFGASSPVDIADYLQRAQYRIKVTGHPAMPDTNVSYQESNTNYSKVDTELDDSLQKRGLMGMGLNAESVNNGFDRETATSVVTNNLMLSRRVMVIQDQVNPHFTSYHQKIARADEELQEKLRDILFNSYDELKIDEDEIAKQTGQEKGLVKPIVIQHIINDFIDGLEVTLPRPNTASLKNQKESLEEYGQLLDLAIEAYMSDEFFTDELGGEVSRNTISIKKMMRAHFMRNYMAENGILPEVAAIVTIADDDKPEFDLWETQKEHIEKLMKSMSGFMKKIHTTKQESDLLVEQLNAASGEDGASGYDSSNSSSDSTSDDSAGEDSFNFDMDTPELTSEEPSLTDETLSDDSVGTEPLDSNEPSEPV